MFTILQVSQFSPAAKLSHGVEVICTDRTKEAVFDKLRKHFLDGNNRLLNHSDLPVSIRRAAEDTIDHITAGKMVIEVSDEKIVVQSTTSGAKVIFVDGVGFGPDYFLLVELPY